MTSKSPDISTNELHDKVSKININNNNNNNNNKSKNNSDNNNNNKSKNNSDNSNKSKSDHSNNSSNNNKPPPTTQSTSNQQQQQPSQQKQSKPKKDVANKEILIVTTGNTYKPVKGINSIVRLAVRDHNKKQNIYLSRPLQRAKDAIGKEIRYRGEKLTFRFITKISAPDYDDQTFIISSEPIDRKTIAKQGPIEFKNQNGELVGILNFIIKIRKHRPATKESIDPRITSLYDIRKRIGSGAYGIVWKARDRKTNEVVAIKKGLDMFRTATDAQRCFREICILEILDHPNIINLLEIYGNADNLDELYLVMELMPSDLFMFIRKGKIEINHISCIIYQLFVALKYLHSANIIHRDLKPENILIDRSCVVKICDFGMARVINQYGSYRKGPWRKIFTKLRQQKNRRMTQQVGTRYYRAPEMLLEMSSYSTSVDIWSIGCILAEMFTSKLLFRGRENYEILNLIIQFSGCTPDDVLNLTGPRTLSRDIVFPKDPVVNFDCIIPEASYPNAHDLFKKLLQFDPNNRITAYDALEHPFVARFHDSEFEPTCKEKIEIELDCNKRFSVSTYRDVLGKRFNGGKESSGRPSTIRSSSFVNYGSNSIDLTGKTPLPKTSRSVSIPTNYVPV